MVVSIMIYIFAGKISVKVTEKQSDKGYGALRFMGARNARFKV
jgi:hypothetical protein